MAGVTTQEAGGGINMTWLLRNPAEYNPSKIEISDVDCPDMTADIFSRKRSILGGGAPIQLVGGAWIRFFPRLSMI